LARFIRPAIAPLNEKTDQDDYHHDSGDTVKNCAALPFEAVAQAVEQVHCRVAKLIVL
jgi:hypothetical protein